MSRAIIDSVPDEKLLLIIADSTTWKEVMHKIGYQCDAGNALYKLKKRAANLGLPNDPFGINRFCDIEPFDVADIIGVNEKSCTVSKIPKDEFITAVKNAKNITDVANQLGLSSNTPHHSISEYIQKRIIEYNIDTTHFEKYNIQERFNHNIDYEDIFKRDSKASQTTLRKKFAKLNMVPYVCNICGMKPIWFQKPLTLVLDHINGDRNDNRLQNLQWVCPNCNSQLDTFAGRNQTNKKTLCEYCGTPLSGYERKQNYTHCKLCRIKIKEQEQENKPEQHISPEQRFGITRAKLKQLLREKPIYKIANDFGITDSAFRKWLPKFGLPDSAILIRKMPDDEWDKL